MTFLCISAGLISSLHLAPLFSNPYLTFYLHITANLYKCKGVRSSNWIKIIAIAKLLSLSKSICKKMEGKHKKIYRLIIETVYRKQEVLLGRHPAH